MAYGHCALNVADVRNGDNGNVQASSEPIAIVGMAMRLPGGGNNGSDFWDMFVEKRDGRIRVPEDRYNVDAFYNASGKTGSVKMQHGIFLQGNLKHLDISFFSMTRSETEKLDPQAPLLLEVSREALENAGEIRWCGEDIGCYVGVFGEDWQDIHLKDSLDSAISNKECSGAIVAGTNLIMTPTMTIAMSEQGILSPDATSKTFDAGADGYARGEAISALYIKPLSKAVADKNPIQAIIRATASNCDGRTPGISHPSSESHEALMRAAYRAAGLHGFDDIGFVECHGTGTSTGDPLEAQAVANVFGKNGVYIGSSKPNVGHSKRTSGVTGIIKSVLALQNEIIPPNINFEVPNPKVPFDKFTVPTESPSWPEDRAPRVCANSFGLGGANATVLLESASSLANHTNSLTKLVDNSKAYLARDPNTAVDLAHTLGARRQHLPFRTYRTKIYEHPVPAFPENTSI